MPHIIKKDFKILKVPPTPPNLQILDLKNHQITPKEVQFLSKRQRYEVKNLTLEEALNILAKNSIEISKEKYKINYLQNIANTSRSIRGEINTSASEDKKDKLVIQSKSNVKTIVYSNLLETFELIYLNKNIYFPTKDHLKNFILKVGYKINKNILKPDSNLLRINYNSQKYNYVKTEHVENFFDSFVAELFQKIDNPRIDKIYLSAWIEWNLDFTGHVFSDGCGRIAKTISTWLFMRYNHPLPQYSLGQGTYDTIRSSYRKQFTPKNKILFLKPTINSEFKLFIKYYSELF